MAEKKIVSANESGRKKTAAGTAALANAGKAGSATGKRVGAVCLWVAAIVLEVLAILVVFGKLPITFMSSLVFMCILLALDLVCVIIGASLWKSANHIDPASEKNKVKFWLWNNMGLIVTVFAFLPFIILTLTNKNADKKTKVVATVAGVIALLIGGLCARDWNPISAEEKAAQEGTYADAALPEGDVYFTKFGKKYHLYETCQHINKSDTLYSAKSSDEYAEVGNCVAVAVNFGCNDVCKTCANKFAKENGIETETKTPETPETETKDGETQE